MSEDPATGLTCLEMKGIDALSGDIRHEDERLFAQAKRFLIEATLTRLRALMWCIVPGHTMTDELKLQARFLSHFGMWSHVVIVVKNHWVNGVEECCQGALAAAVQCGARREVLLGNAVKVMLEETMERAFLDRSVPPEMAEKLCIKSRNTVRNECLGIMSNMGSARRVT